MTGGAVDYMPQLLYYTVFTILLNDLLGNFAEFYGGVHRTIQASVKFVSIVIHSPSNRAILEISRMCEQWNPVTADIAGEQAWVETPL